MTIAPDKVISMLRTSPYNVLYSSETSADAVAKGLDSNTIIKFLKIRSVQQNPKLILDKLKYNESLLYLHIGIYIINLDRTRTNEYFCECVANMIKCNTHIIELVLGIYYDI